MKNTFVRFGTDTLCISHWVYSEYVASFRLQFLFSLNQVGSSYRDTMFLWFKPSQKMTLA